MTNNSSCILQAKQLFSGSLTSFDREKICKIISKYGGEVKNPNEDFYIGTYLQDYFIIDRKIVGSDWSEALAEILENVGCIVGGFQSENGFSSKDDDCHGIWFSKIRLDVLHYARNNKQSGDSVE